MKSENPEFFNYADLYKKLSDRSLIDSLLIIDFEYIEKHYFNKSMKKTFTNFVNMIKQDAISLGLNVKKIMFLAQNITEKEKNYFINFFLNDALFLDNIIINNQNKNGKFYILKNIIDKYSDIYFNSFIIFTLDTDLISDINKLKVKKPIHIFPSDMNQIFF